MAKRACVMDDPPIKPRERSEQDLVDLWVATECLCLLYQRYALHSCRGCTAEMCVDHGLFRVCHETLLCPCCHKTSPDITRRVKYFASRELSKMFCEVAKTHNKPVNKRTMIALLMARHPDMSSIAPRSIFITFPLSAHAHCWGIEDWDALALELAAIAPHTKFRVLAARDQIQRFKETTGRTHTQASAILRRLTIDNGIACPNTDTLTVHQMVQFARLHNIKAFDFEMDKVKIRVAMSMEKEAALAPPVPSYNYSPTIQSK